MVEAAVSLVIESLGNALGQEVIFLGEVQDKFERLQSELVSIQGFLKNADAMSLKNTATLNWVAQVRDIAYDVDYVLSAFFHKIADEKRRSSNVLQCAFKPRKLVDVHKMGMEIEKILTKIEDVSNRRKRYGAEIGEGTSSSTTNNEVRLRRVYPHSKDVDIIGLEIATSTLVKELLKEDDRYCVVSICGMGGIGKTTLAKLVYNHDDVKCRFGFRAWTFVSQNYRVEYVMREILRQVSSMRKEDIERMNEVELVEKIFATLTRMRYLVVLDDMWNVEDWGLLKSAFPDGITGSKVILTTRNKKIAAEADPRSHHFEPQILSEDDAWDLLSKKSFPKKVIGTSSSLLSDLEKCGRGMVNRCGGLPLAIIVLGGLLATKKSLNEWETVFNQIVFHLSQGEQTGVHAILGLSYIDLPLHLKPLFLYLGLFPEDFQIPVNVLVRMWIAEGLVSQKQGNPDDTESIARHYLDELIQRCVIQIAETNLEGNAKTCQMHDMMRDVCIAKAREENFLEIIGNSVSSSNSPSCGTKLRRCAIYLEDERYVFPPYATPRMLSVIFSKAPTYKYSSLSIVYEDFKLVKVLELKGVHVPVEVKFGEIVGKLINLRYLGLRETGLKELPRSIGNLAYLQTLDVRGALYGSKLPNVIWKMEELRHFQIDRVTCENSDPLRMGTLKKLLTLTHIRAESWTVDMVRSANLQKLGVIQLTYGNVDSAINSIVVWFDKLRSLSLSMSNRHAFSKLERLSEMHHLLKLRLEGRTDSFPARWPLNIVKLQLFNVEANQDLMPVLEKLESLAYLTLDNAYDGKQILCSSKGFPKLQYLSIIGFPHLEEWVVEKGAMPCLMNCSIFSCKKLKMIPEGFKFVTTLQSLKIRAMPIFFLRVKQGGEDWVSVQHIPSIIIY
ncbi:hypothetical protein ACHQM5_018418 [Ranunculus cassubicifolius]